MYKKRIITIFIVICLFSISSNVNASPYNSPSYFITATINDVWMENNDCKMEITIIDFLGNFTFLDEYRPEKYGIKVGRTIEITIFFQEENGSREILQIPGSHGYKTGDEIEGRIYLIGDEKGEEYYFHAIALSDKNYAREKDIDSKKESSPFHLISVIFILLLIILVIIIFIKRKKYSKKKLD